MSNTSLDNVANDVIVSNEPVILKSQDVIQSYIFTAAAYEATIYEKRIMYRIILGLQDYICGKKLSSSLRIEPSSEDDLFFSIRTRDICPEKDTKHSEHVKNALIRLLGRRYIFDDGKVWAADSFIASPKYNMRRGWVSFRLPGLIFRALLDFSKGFSRYDISVALSLQSVYSMRLYELICRNKSDVYTYSVDFLREMFGLEGQYRNNADFIRRVIEPARQELDARAPVSFTYEVKRSGRKIVALELTRVRFKNRSAVTDKKHLISEVGLFWDFSSEERALLHDEGFTDREIRNNIELLKLVKKHVGLAQTLAELRGPARKAQNPKGYIIGAMKNIVNET